MRKNRFRNFFIAVLLIAVLLMSTLVVSARDTNKFKTLPKNKWSKTASYCFYRYSKKQKGYIYTYYRIKVPYDSVLTFKMKGQKKNDPVYGVRLWKTKKKMLAGGDGKNYVAVLHVNEPIVLKKGTYYVEWFDCSKNKSKIKYTLKKITKKINSTPETATTLVPGKEIYMYQTIKDHKPRWYKLKLDKKQKITFWSRDYHYDYLTFYDSNMNRLEKDSIYNPFENTMTATKGFTTLAYPPGTYYLKMDSWIYEKYEANYSKVKYGFANVFKWK